MLALHPPRRRCDYLYRLVDTSPLFPLLLLSPPRPPGTPARSFNKRPEDFSSLEAYNDYLEEYESITFSLIHSIGSDLATTEAKIRSYELQNRASIEDNEERLARERDELERRERGEREWREGERRRFLEEEQRREREREEERKRIVEELVSPLSTLSLSLVPSLPAPCRQLTLCWLAHHQGTSNASAAQILALHRKRSTARNFSPPSGGSSASEVDPSLKLKFLSNLASSSSSAPKDSPAPEPSYDPLLDPLSDLTLYLPLPSSLPPLSLLPRRSLAPPGTKTYDPSLGTLVREAARDDSGGFSADEVWEKAVRVGMAGLGDAPVGWGVREGEGEGARVGARVGARAGGEAGGAMELGVGA